MKKTAFVISDLIRYYNDRQLPLASAALSYYLMMTFFPLIICLYTLLGNSYYRAMEVLDFTRNFLHEDTVQTLKGFLSYVSENNSPVMFYAGLMILLISASAGVRSMLVTLGRMEQAYRYRGIIGYLLSLVFAVIFLAAIYFGILVMFTSRELLNALNERIPFLDISGSWLWLKYLLFGGGLFLIFWALYAAAKPAGSRMRTWPGAIFTMLGMVIMSLVFSAFIAASARYSLVYGSLASVILLMYWMYLNGQIIYLGAALNLSLNDLKVEEIV